MNDKIQPSEMSILVGLEAVRQRPTLYLGELDNQLIPNILLREALCCARDEAIQGNCKRIEIRLESDGRAVVRDDGPGLPLAMGACGMRVAEYYLTSLHSGCAAGKSSQEIARTTCVLTLAVLNALSSELSLRIFSEGKEWAQEYRDGAATSSLDIVGENIESGTEISFQLDQSILIHREFDFAEFAEWAEANVKRLEIHIRDLRSGEVANIPCAQE